MFIVLHPFMLDTQVSLAVDCICNTIEEIATKGYHVKDSDIVCTTSFIEKYKHCVSLNVIHNVYIALNNNRKFYIVEIAVTEQNNNDIFPTPVVPFWSDGYAVNWIEYESGWGSRPDDVSLHLSYSDVEIFISHYSSCGSYECFSRPEDVPKLVKFSPEIVSMFRSGAQPVSVVWYYLSTSKDKQVLMKEHNNVFYFYKRDEVIDI